MKLKPFNDVDEHNIINLFAFNASSGNKGSLVTITNASGFVSNQELTTTSLTSEPNVVSLRYSVPARVRYAASGEGKGEVLGMMLYDTRESDYLGRPLIYDPTRKAEAQAVVSGEAVPVVRRGMFLISGMVGTPGAGSGAQAADDDSGDFLVLAPGDANSVGTFLGSVDANGYALFLLDC